VSRRQKASLKVTCLMDLERIIFDWIGRRHRVSCSLFLRPFLGDLNFNGATVGRSRLTSSEFFG